MSQSFQSAEGIILRVIPFRDYDQIFFIFTSDAGLIKVIHKNSLRRGKAQSVCLPLTKVEVIYRENSGEISHCQEMTSLDSFSALRKEWIFLEVACDLLQAISASQLVGKEAPQLYALLNFYLKKIPETPHPWIVAASFRLKLLKHDGLVLFPFRCSDCHQLIHDKAFIRDFEAWCERHQLIGCQSWDKIELEMMYRLAECQSFREIYSDDISPELRNKMNVFFDACVKR